MQNVMAQLVALAGLLAVAEKAAVKNKLYLMEIFMKKIVLASMMFSMMAFSIFAEKNWAFYIQI